MKLAKWMKKGARVTANGKPGEIYKISAYNTGGDTGVFKIMVRLDGDTHADAYEPEKVSKLVEKVVALPPIYSIKTLKQRTYDTVPLSPEFIEEMGEIESRTVIMVYGPSGSGKSVKVMKLANDFAKNVGKVFYNSHEEAANKSMKLRAIAHEIDSPNLFVASRYSFEQMMFKLKTTYYRLVIIDSVQRMRFTPDQLEQLQNAMKKRRVVILMVSFGKSLGVTRGADELLHDSDVKMFLDQGKLTVVSRYLDQPLEKTLFVPQKAAKSVQKTLF